MLSVPEFSGANFQSLRPWIWHTQFQPYVSRCKPVAAPAEPSQRHPSPPESERPTSSHGTGLMFNSDIRRYEQYQTKARVKLEVKPGMCISGISSNFGTLCAKSWHKIYKINLSYHKANWRTLQYGSSLKDMSAVKEATVKQMTTYIVSLLVHFQTAPTRMSKIKSFIFFRMYILT